MQRPLIIAAILTLLCYQSCVCRPTNNRVGNSRDELSWRALLLVDPDTAPKPRNEEGKRRRITPKSVFIAPAFSGGSPLPDCAEGYRADSMGRCVKLVQLNHAAQLEFLLQRLNAMYASPVVRRGYEDLTTSDSQSGPLHVSIPLEIPPEPEEETKESVEVAVVMADVFKDGIKNNNEKSEVDKPQTIVAVWNVGKNGSSLEEVENASDLDEQIDTQQSDKSNTTKYEIVNDRENGTTPKAKPAFVEDEELLSTAPTTILLPEGDVESFPEKVKTQGSAMDLLEEVSDISSEDGRTGNTSRRNASNTEHKRQTTTTESTTSTEIEQITTETVMKKPNTPTESDEIQVAMETKVGLESTTQRGFVRFPTERNSLSDEDRIETEGVRQNLVRFPQPWDYAMPSLPFSPSEIQQRQTFWWLPPGWRLDPTRHQPMLIRFWARMPLLRDQHSDTADGYHDFYSDRRRRPLVY
ncbi:uncharacterized protein [Periplaneta americana]|uniref:Uncharacterized protein n=1 Tax=Periplaneta americana TaxID=6978 RepID=A0ABQ8TBB0_PERAM|nr:hypothetical protein ANN_04919 [Periplaneta americana]